MTERDCTCDDEDLAWRLRPGGGAWCMRCGAFITHRDVPAAWGRSVMRAMQRVWLEGA